MDVMYLDLWFGLNALCDYLLCLLTARAAGLVLRRRRYALAALLGALYACAAWLPGLGFLARPLWRLLCGVGMGLIAFGRERRPLRCVLLFFAVSASFGGALTALSAGGGTLRALLASFLLCYGVGALLFRVQGLFQGRRLVAVEVCHRGRSARFSALRDTGNSLRDPVSGARVLVASPKALAPILGEFAALFETLDPLSLQALSGQLGDLGALRLLPYAALGGGGLLPVLRPEKILLDGRACPGLLLGLSPHAQGEDFEGII